MTMDNAWGTGRSFMTAAYIDVPGTEMEWITGNRITDRPGFWGPPSDGDLLLMRAFTGTKPYLLLMNARFEFMDARVTERYFLYSLFYGMFPGFFSHNASSSTHYFRNPEWYNRDRNLFRRYLPLIKDVADAGWRPEILARVSDPDVLVERYGPGDEGVTFFTLRNVSAENRKAYLSFDPADFGLKTGDLTVWDPDGHRTLEFAVDKGEANLDLPLEPGEIRTVAVGTLPARVGWELGRGLELVGLCRRTFENLVLKGDMDKSAAGAAVEPLSAREGDLEGLLKDGGSPNNEFLADLAGLYGDLRETEDRISATGDPKVADRVRCRLRQAATSLGAATAAATGVETALKPSNLILASEKSKRMLTVVNNGPKAIRIDSLELLPEPPLTARLDGSFEPAELAPGDSLEVPVTFSLPKTAPLGRDIGLGAVFAANTDRPVVLGGWYWCRTVKPVEEELRLIDIEPSGSNFKLELDFTNRSDEPTYFHFDFKRPAGWTGYPLPNVATMVPGSGQKFECIIRAPENSRPGRYGIKIEMTPDRNNGLPQKSMELVYAPERMNLLRNPGFEESRRDTLEDWSGDPSSYSLDYLRMVRGGASLYIEHEDPGESTVLSQTVELNQSKPRPLYVRGFCRAEGTSIPGQWASAVRVTLEYYDGVRRGENILHFHGKDFDWRVLDGVLTPERAVRRAEFSVVFRGSATGKIWYDNLYLTELK
jgi:hypothetical protein